MDSLQLSEKQGFEIGGDEGIRTLDLLSAIQGQSQELWPFSFNDLHPNDCPDSHLYPFQELQELRQCQFKSVNTDG